MIDQLRADQVAQFQRDGFLILERLIDPDDAARLAGRFEPLFRGQFETGLHPDEWNWQEGRDLPDRTRQICNGWKSDYTVASVVLRREIGRLCAQLAGWPGARIAQDNVIWKPPCAKSLGYHQDNAYNGWIVPGEMLSCWIALDRTSADGGTVEYVKGSHLWGPSPPAKQFHAPADYREEMIARARAMGHEPEIHYVEVPPGGCAFHHGWTWHGSGPNRGDHPRRSAVSHCMSSEAVYHPTEISYIYNRYKRIGDTAMDESYFPVLWRDDGYRTTWLDQYMQRGSFATLRR
ncbi:MAG: phytanoyl-CoA dioxygenase family protein [Rhodospirillaceae bacterium]|nr:MAG: phytanoyl-CoA dioxygenase family protein [Rhodospirillaceae bacterium]